MYDTLYTVPHDNFILKVRNHK